ncbi:MAG: polysaccharide biosynthesis C-terminal domain-containing protein, partial [Paramuribaculum sp.]|nr:polysaccharide biosynthesis C-terminal domain-containing protein [Paramuribaculum sp.]
MHFIHLFIRDRYPEGVGVVPIIMLGELFFGICFNLSLWYKLTDRTPWGMWLTLIGLAVVVSLNILLVPRIGFYGCAWASFCCYGTMMVLSYFLGQKYFPVNYHVSRLAVYFFTALGIYGVLRVSETANIWINMGVGTLWLFFYIALVLRVEGVSPASLIPTGRLRNRRN